MNSFGRALALVAAFGLAACEDGAGGTNNIFDDIATVTGGGQSEAQRDLASANRQYAQARLAATAAGAGAGLIGCLLAECTREQTIAATIVGGAAGYIGGVALTRQNQEFQVSQTSLQRDLDRAKSERENLTRGARAASRVVEFQRAEIRRLNAGIQNGTVTRDQYRAAYRQMQGDLQQTQSLIAKGNESIDGLNNSITAYSRGGISTAQLRREREAQRRELSRLRTAERNINNALRSVPQNVRSS